MPVKLKRHQLRRYFVLPGSLLILNAVEDLLIVKLQQWVLDPFLLTAAIMMLFLIGLSIVGFLIAPVLEVVIEKSYAQGKVWSGHLGGWIILAGLCGGLYWIYYKIYIDGASTLVRLIEAQI